MNILFVDDDKFFGIYYVNELRAQFPNDTVDIAVNIDDAVSYVKREKSLRGIVLDIMMPKPTLYSEELGIYLDDGLSTGIWFLRFLKNDIVARGIRVLTITNKNLTDVERGVAAIEFAPGTAMCFRKADLPAAMLPIRLKALLSRGA